MFVILKHAEMMWNKDEILYVSMNTEKKIIDIKTINSGTTTMYYERFGWTWYDKLKEDYDGLMKQLGIKVVNDGEDK